jgi:hypothetical protein
LRPYNEIKMRFLGPLILLLSSFVTVVFVYFHVSTRNEQIVVALLLLILFVYVNRLIVSSEERSKSGRAKYFTLFLSALLVQLLVISSGGFYSPFLFLFYLFLFGSSLLMGNAIAICFLGLAVCVLFLDIKLDPTIQQNFQQDPWPTVLYFVSFVVIAPVSFLVTRSYRVKDSLSQLLKEYVQLGKMREESILSGVNELVFVTDISLSILYINSTAEKEISMVGNQVMKQNLLQVINLRDINGNNATIQSLTIDKALIDKAARTVDGFYLSTKHKTKVSIQIRPIADLNGKVTQIVFVLTNAQFTGSDPTNQHLNLVQATNKYRAIFDDLQKTLVLSGSKELIAKVELVHKFEEDIMIATEIEDHSIKERASFQDVALLCKQIVVTKQNFAKGLQIPLEFVLAKNEADEASLLSFAETTSSTANLPISNYMVPADFKWLSVMIQKIIDISLLLSIGEVNPGVKFH